MDSIETIFSNLAKHMVTGLMIHDQFESYYSFLNFPAYAKCHEEQYHKESCNYLCLKKHYMEMHDKLIQEQSIANPQTIPPTWINYKRMDVDVNTKRNAVKTGLEKWMDWEKDTKEMYERAYKDLMELGEVADALFVKKLIKDVCCELQDIKKWYIAKHDTDFSIESILEDQDD